MAVEIEHKYLVRKDLWYAQQKPAGIPILQGYINTGTDITVRVRTIGDKAFLTIKGPSQGASRLEFEYPVPFEDAKEMLDKLCVKYIDKVRYRFEYKGKLWEIDEFFGHNDGLIIAEIELTSPDEEYEKPSWLGEEVTGDPRYFNSNLAQ